MNWVFATYNHGRWTTASARYSDDHVAAWVEGWIRLVVQPPHEVESVRLVWAKDALLIRVAWKGGQVELWRWRKEVS